MEILETELVSRKLVSWNVNGIRAAYRKGLADFLQAERPDVLCLQETKARPDQLSEEEASPAGYTSAFASAKKAGYSGVATFCRANCPPKEVKAAIGMAAYDNEGRFVISDHDDFILYNIYFPSGTSGEVRQNFKYGFLDDLYAHLKNLPKAQRDRVIICGDYNICHKPIDIHHPAQAEKLGLSGFLPDERAWMDRFAALGFVDSFRQVHGAEVSAYSWWSFRANSRAKNLGWRIDYFFVAEALRSKIKDAAILPHVQGSDHCPVSLTLSF